jgi:hypothetical protein
MRAGKIGSVGSVQNLESGNRKLRNDRANLGGRIAVHVIAAIAKGVVDELDAEDRWRVTVERMEPR